MLKPNKKQCRYLLKYMNNDWNDRDGRCYGEKEKDYWPVCPIVKTNLTTGINGLTSDHVK